MASAATAGMTAERNECMQKPYPPKSRQVPRFRYSGGPRFRGFPHLLLRNDFGMSKRLAIAAALVAVLAAGTVAHAGIFGPEPTAVSAGHAPSGAPAISGDNRVVRYVAFHSFASDLTPGDTNGALDVFVLRRATRKLTRVSVSSTGRQANGASGNPALDGSVQHAPHCVAFQSQATNLAAGDRDRSWDIYLRDLRTRKTRLVSRGIGPSAVDPAISGDCRQVAFTSAGRIYVSKGGGKPRFLAKGTNPDLALDGSAITWERGHGAWLKRDGRTSQVAKIGGNPHVSDGGSSRTWAVVYDTASDVYMKAFKRTGGSRKTVHVSRGLGGTSHNGGVTAYGLPRGIVMFTNTQGGQTTLWYMNLHSGNIDDLAHGGEIFDVATSARGNYAVFSSTSSFRGDANGSTQDVFLKFLSGQ